ncbi:hypothetical protein AMS68_006308 [Peltaster fructicola]|uniref:Uncharacterized protein n=1 Tax=Peltaster fructicola TaxID=286661 RepID=A0A6H0Y1K1_9PEZI|nr:hypothetical protein AMS68_006308 [Peltaster fructicola]
MTFQQEFSSWFSPVKAASTEPPKIGSKAPRSSKLELEHGRPAIVVFLRHCGCPFAEKTFLRFRETAQRHHDINFYALSHSDENATQNWLKALPQAGSEPSNLKVIVDHDRQAYSAWGLGASSWGHFLSPSALYETYRVGKEEGFWNRPTESGSRWQQSGFWAVTADGIVRWGRATESAGDVPDFEDGVSALS